MKIVGSLPSLYYRRACGDQIETYKFTHSRSTKLSRSHYSARLTPRQETTLTSSRKNAVIRGLEPISSVTASPTDGTICVMTSSLPRLDHQHLTTSGVHTSTISNNNDFPPLDAHQHQSSTERLKGEQPTKAEEDMVYRGYMDILLPLA